MKPKQQTNPQEKGFTLIELLVVISIMAVITGLLVIDFAGQRAVRNQIIAKNETATNIRKVQGYMLSSKNISGNTSAKFYLLTFTKSSSYKIQAIDTQYAFHDNLENINLPQGITVSNLQIGNTSYNCIQVIYSAPFGTMYVYGSNNVGDCGASIATILNDPVQLAALSQSTSYIVFQGTVGDPAGKYVQINPLTAQVSTH